MRCCACSCACASSRPAPSSPCPPPTCCSPAPAAWPAGPICLRPYARARQACRGGHGRGRGRSTMLNEGDMAPDVTLGTPEGGTLSPVRAARPSARPLFLSQGRHFRLHRRGAGLHPPQGRLRSSPAPAFSASPGTAAKDHGKFIAKHDLEGAAGHRPGWLGVRGVRHLDREIHVRPQILGIDRATFLIDGRWPHRAHLAQGEGARPCRGGAEGRRGPHAA